MIQSLFHTLLRHASGALAGKAGVEGRAYPRAALLQVLQQPLRHVVADVTHTPRDRRQLVRRRRQRPRRLVRLDAEPVLEAREEAVIDLQVQRLLPGHQLRRRQGANQRYRTADT